MENASKALIIAGAILLSILIIGLGVFVYQKAAGAMEGIGLDSTQIAAYNAEFEQFQGTQSGSSVRRLCDAIRSHNNANQDDNSLKIGIVYGDKGVDKAGDTSNLDKNIGNDVDAGTVNAVRNAISQGKMYTVTFHMAKSGRIISATIADK